MLPFTTDFSLLPLIIQDITNYIANHIPAHSQVTYIITNRRFYFAYFSRSEVVAGKIYLQLYWLRNGKTPLKTPSFSNCNHTLRTETIRKMYYVILSWNTVYKTLGMSWMGAVYMVVVGLFLFYFSNFVLISFLKTYSFICVVLVHCSCHVVLAGSYIVAV
jgi:hypothetical protein